MALRFSRKTIKKNEPVVALNPKTVGDGIRGAKRELAPMLAKAYESANKKLQKVS